MKCFKFLCAVCVVISLVRAETSTRLEQNLREERDLAVLNLQNYLGEIKRENFLQISEHGANYFLPFSYTFKGKYPRHKRTEAKFQISLKKPLFENIFGFDEKFYFAYTQTAWWQLYKDSSPFREINYQPEFFVSVPLYIDQFENLKNVRISLLHESNGKDDTELQSRSWNRVYISTLLVYDRFFITPRLWYRLPEKDDDNKDITSYMGNFDLAVSYLAKDYFTSVLVRNNLNFKRNKGALQFDAGFDFWGNGVFLYVQYFNGYGESLIDYNRYLHKFSLGFYIAY
ncbi:phospholipase [Campylobacter sp. MIT 12-5580]|uniref:phospholipase A n=1 Tax=Campylobacter sp. MIT 12-5580 TaxID=2040651 RepID=UPI0010F5C8C8|nr:phospholipase A [Campylobacter sp. MIT 12-5580]TKX30178.1 phospholipase [Campylobacter sp. MIT 12-5580]